MSFINTFFAVFIGSITGSFTTYLIQRYFFKKVLDNALDGFENKILSFLRGKMEK